MANILVPRVPFLQHVGNGTLILSYMVKGGMTKAPSHACSSVGALAPSEIKVGWVAVTLIGAGPSCALITALMWLKVGSELLQRTNWKPWQSPCFHCEN